MRVRLCCCGWCRCSRLFLSSATAACGTLWWPCRLSRRGPRELFIVSGMGCVARESNIPPNGRRSFGQQASSAISLNAGRRFARVRRRMWGRVRAGSSQPARRADPAKHVLDEDAEARTPVVGSAGVDRFRLLCIAVPRKKANRGIRLTCARVQPIAVVVKRGRTLWTRRKQARYQTRLANR